MKHAYAKFGDVCHTVGAAFFLYHYVAEAVGEQTGLPKSFPSGALSGWPVWLCVAMVVANAALVVVHLKMHKTGWLRRLWNKRQTQALPQEVRLDIDLGLTHLIQSLDPANGIRNLSIFEPVVYANNSKWRGEVGALMTTYLQARAKLVAAPYSASISMIVAKGCVRWARPLAVVGQTRADVRVMANNRALGNQGFVVIEFEDGSKAAFYDLYFDMSSQLKSTLSYVSSTTPEGNERIARLLQTFNMFRAEKGVKPIRLRGYASR